MLPVSVRRISAEWELLGQLAAANPHRLTDLHRTDSSVSVRLHRPVIARARAGAPVDRHDVDIRFPVHFPAVPMEMFLAVPVFHPNVHPHTGFVCLWDRHRVSNTVEHALHKLVAMLAGALQNRDATHVMQPEALGTSTSGSVAEPLQGTRYEPVFPNAGQAVLPRRRRLL